MWLPRQVFPSQRAQRVGAGNEPFLRQLARLGSMRILVIEDDRKTAGFLRKGLTEAGFVVDVAETAEDGLFQVTSASYDAVLLDVMLPDKEGWWVLGEMRRQGLHVPVICLTARGSVPDRVKGLELGADDYVVKPFAFSELLARLRAVLRRTPEPREEVIRVADLEVDLTRHRATRAGKLLDLSAKEFALLALLARRAGQVLTRTMIAELVWDASFDFDSNVVDVAIHRLREKVDKPFAFPLIHTLRGVGYVLEPRESPEKHAR
ncbi:Transcriptional activator protein CzcR [bacterium HR09]|nr:Transcriptional activator protein CzcR [bacterium HR09]